MVFFDEPTRQGNSINPNQHNSQNNPNNPQSNHNYNHLSNSTRRDDDTNYVPPHQDNIHTFTPAQQEEFIDNCLREKLIRHRLTCANTVPYNNKLDGSFTSQEHEYICEKIMYYKHYVRPSTWYDRYIEGAYPERKYVGKIGNAFIENIFPKRR
jgi:hypothetical protein